MNNPCTDKRTKRVITYGTFDLLHHGHIRLLRRAKALGDYLIVGITSDSYDRYRGKLNVRQSLIERIETVRNIGLADEIIVEEYEGQKIDDIIRYNVDIFAIGSDWVGCFNYLEEYCKVVYLERTKGISSTQLRNQEPRDLCRNLNMSVESLWKVCLTFTSNLRTTLQIVMNCLFILIIIMIS